MNYKYVKAVILDWAGTTVDHGSLAPVAALQRVFEESGVAITAGEARQDMGLLKKDQIRLILAGERVGEEWRRSHGALSGERDVERIFADFLPKQTEILAAYSRPIDGVCETIEEWRGRGLRIGSTTGYTRALLDIVAEAAARYGYRPDASFTPDQAGAGRPAPFMCYRNAIELQVFPLSSFVKIGDTPSDIAEGRNAGMWTIGITATGNEIGLASADFAALPAAEQQRRIAQAETRLREAHYLARSVAECRVLIDEIDQRIAHGERPR